MVHTILISPEAPGRFDVRLSDDERVFVESSSAPYLESARQLLASGFAAPLDEDRDAVFGLAVGDRRGRIQDALRNAPGRPRFAGADGALAAGADAPLGVLPDDSAGFPFSPGAPCIGN
jgi:hypothetical protein